MNKLNVFLVAVLVGLCAIRATASNLDSLQREIMDNQAIINYQIETGELDIELVKYNNVLRTSLKMKCKNEAKKCQHLQKGI